MFKKLIIRSLSIPTKLLARLRTRAYLAVAMLGFASLLTAMYAAGMPSAAVAQTSTTPMPNLPPENVRITKRGTDYLKVKWDEPSHPMVRGIIHNSHLWGLCYDIYYRQRGSGDSDWTKAGMYWMETEKHSAKISGLSPGAQYEVKVVATVEQYSDDFNTYRYASDVVSGTTLPETDMITVRKLNAVSVGKRIRITWKRPHQAPQLGITGYVAQYVAQPAANSRPSANSPRWTDVCRAEGNICDATARKTAMFNVEKNSQMEYFMRVAPITSKGQGKWSYYPKSWRHGLIVE